jgi:hypothetical protein
MPENEIAVELEKEPKFKLVNEVNETKTYSFEFLPTLGIISPDPKCLMVAETCFRIFNPCAAETVKNVKVGDMIALTCDTDHKVMKAWNPPAEYQLEPGYTNLYRVRHVSKDTNGMNVIVADENI